MLLQPYGVATVLTACGIETQNLLSIFQSLFLVATVLTACGIETMYYIPMYSKHVLIVATVLTACGIETSL